MIKKLGQYGGYLLSGILIAWLINPIAALAIIEVFFKINLLIPFDLNAENSRRACMYHFILLYVIFAYAFILLWLVCF